MNWRPRVKPLDVLSVLLIWRNTPTTLPICSVLSTSRIASQTLHVILESLTVCNGVMSLHRPPLSLFGLSPDLRTFYLRTPHVSHIWSQNPVVVYDNRESQSSVRKLRLTGGTTLADGVGPIGNFTRFGIPVFQNERGILTEYINGERDPQTDRSLLEFSFPSRPMVILEDGSGFLKLQRLSVPFIRFPKFVLLLVLI